jgi:voltage-gated potassium channel Kch
MRQFLTITVGVLFVIIAGLYLDFLNTDISIMQELVSGRNLVFAVLITFSIYFTLLFAPMKQKDAIAELLLVVATLQFIPIVIVAFAYCYLEVGLKNAVEPSDYLYFSIVTFTTLGYGDITPSEASKYFAAFQALTGFIFVPVLFAQFVTVLRDFNPNGSEPSIALGSLALNATIEPSEAIDLDELLAIPEEQDDPAMENPE